MKHFTYKLSALAIALFITSFFFYGSQWFNGAASGKSSALSDSDVFVMIKTGACEDKSKLKALLQYSLQNATRRMIFSDLEESFDGVQLHDTFAGLVNPKYLDTIDAFVLYKKLQATGTCDGLTPDDLDSVGVQLTNGNYESRGWNLDRFKYLPMIAKTWDTDSSAKWYMMVETDAYVFWPNVLEWLSTLDHHQELYIGSLTSFGGDVNFAYGGSGIIISSAAMKKLAQHFRDDSAAQDKALTIWCGDCLLGATAGDVGFTFLSGVHEMVRDTPGDGFHYDRNWCTGAVSYHHIIPEAAENLMELQHKWSNQSPGRVMRHRDIFLPYVMPQFFHDRDKWDNRSPDEQQTGDNEDLTIHDCETICLHQSDCLQYRLSGGKCFTSTIPAIGHALSSNGTPVWSGWMLERIARWAQNRTCPPWKKAWPRPSGLLSWHNISLTVAVLAAVGLGLMGIAISCGLAKDSKIFKNLLDRISHLVKSRYPQSHDHSDEIRLMDRSD